MCVCRRSIHSTVCIHSNVYYVCTGVQCTCTLILQGKLLYVLCVCRRSIHSTVCVHSNAYCLCTWEHVSLYNSFNEHSYMFCVCTGERVPVHCTVRAGDHPRGPNGQRVHDHRRGRRALRHRLRSLHQHQGIRSLTWQPRFNHEGRRLNPLPIPGRLK